MQTLYGLDGASAPSRQFRQIPSVMVHNTPCCRRAVPRNQVLNSQSIGEPGQGRSVGGGCTAIHPRNCAFPEYEVSGPRGLRLTLVDNRIARSITGPKVIYVRALGPEINS